jgi:6-phosphogluconolactonase
MTQPSRSYHLLADAAALAAAAAEALVQEIVRTHAAGREFHLGLSGGSTPRALYLLLGSPLLGRVDWSRVHLWFGDERCVGPEHADSNYKMAHEALGLGVIGRAKVHRVGGEAPPAEEAVRFASELAVLPKEEGVPQFDVLLLGMGGDGHTASLFPTTGAALVRDRWAMTVVPPGYVKPAVARVTVTAPVIQAARHVWVLMAGADKAEMLAEIVRGAEQLDARPLQLVRKAKHHVGFWLDVAAAAKLQL